MPRVRDFGGISGRELVRVEFLLPVPLMRRLARVAHSARSKGLVRGRDQVVQEVLEAFLEQYENKTLAARAAAAASKE